MPSLATIGLVGRDDRFRQLSAPINLVSRRIGLVGLFRDNYNQEAIIIWMLYIAYELRYYFSVVIYNHVSAL